MVIPSRIGTPDSPAMSLEPQLQAGAGISSMEDVSTSGNASPDYCHMIVAMLQVRTHILVPATCNLVRALP